MYVLNDFFKKGAYIKISQIFLILGWISSLGISVVANFQVISFC